MRHPKFRQLVLVMISGTCCPGVLFAQASGSLASESLEDRVARLEMQNAQLIEILQQQAASSFAPPQTTYPTSPYVAPAYAPAAVPPPPPPPPPVDTGRHQQRRSGGLVGINPEYGYKVLDHAEGVNSKPLLILETAQLGGLDDTLTISGGVTVLANYQTSNRNSKFAWLMRHPTSRNQIGKKASEIVAHSAQLAVTARLSQDFTAYAELLYNPEQSFGAGTITDINRNQIEMRKAFIMWGNLDKRPVYAVAGKIDVPFGLQDTVSPFTNSTSWHAFAPLAYGGYVGYYDHGFHLRATAIQGGAQFRAANTVVAGTSVPSKLNNFAFDGNYTVRLADNFNVMAGGSYIHGSTYCQGYPVFHFNPCTENVPAWAAYGTIKFGGLKLLGEYAETTKTMDGTAVPDPANPLSQFAKTKVTALTVGGRYSIPYSALPVDISVEFSNFTAGDDGAPWERQNQWVAGLSHYIVPNVNIFWEYVRTAGWVPLNFMSGGNFPDGSTWSDRDARGNIFAVGIQAAF